LPVPADPQRKATKETTKGSSDSNPRRWDVPVVGALGIEDREREAGSRFQERQAEKNACQEEEPAAIPIAAIAILLGHAGMFARHGRPRGMTCGFACGNIPNHGCQHPTRTLPVYRAQSRELFASGYRLYGPAVAVRVAEEDERAPRELLDLADVDPALDELRTRGVYVRDHQL
jgi:hypothetical protein